MQTRSRRLVVAALVTIATAVASTPAGAAFPDQGNRVLYVRVPGGGPARGTGAIDLFTIRNKGDDRRRVTNSANVVELGGHTSPDGDHIVYWGVSKATGYRVYTAEADGSHRTPLTSNPISHNPSWSRTGNVIVYVKTTSAPTGADFLGSGRRGPSGSELMIMDADGSGKHSILSGELYAPGWSPTDNLIAFSAPTKGGYGIWQVRPSGSDVTPVVQPAGTALFADWSPNGARMLYQFLPSTTSPGGPSPGGVEIWTVRANGNDPQLVTDDAAELSSLPRYSNDGQRVIYMKSKDGNDELYSVLADGSGGKKRLTETSAGEWLDRILA